MELIENPTPGRKAGKKLAAFDVLETVRVLLCKEAPAEDIDALIRSVLRDERRARLTAETLQRAKAALNSTLDLNQVLALILEQLQQVVQFDSASLMLIEGDKIRIHAVRGHPNPKQAFKWNLWRGIIQWLEELSALKIFDPGRCSGG